VLVDGEPRTLGIYDLCNEYIGHRLTVIVRRTRHRIGKAEDRLHIVTGLLTALDSIDEVVAIIRGSEDTAAARKQLMKSFKLSLIQTDHILDMPLKRLTALETRRLESERDQLTADIADLKKLLSSEQRRRTLVLTELADAVKQFGHPRLTEITHPDDLPVFEVSEVADDIADESCVVTLTTSGQIGRLPVDGARRATPGRHDVLVASTVTRTTSKITAVTSEGRALQMLVAELSDGGGRARGGSASQLFGTNRGETILTIVSGGEEPLVVVSAAGVAKRLTPDEVRDTQGGKQLIKLKQGDRLVAAFRAPAEVDMVMVASDAQALRTPTGAVSIQGRGASGVAGMKLRGDATVIGAAATIGDEALITVTSDSCAKATPMADMETRGRGGVGVRVTKLGDDTSLTLMDVGEPLGLLAVMASDDDPRKPDPNPVPLMLEPGRRDLVSTSTERQVLALGPARW